MAISLANVDNIPDDIRDRLLNYQHIFRYSIFLEDLLEYSPLLGIAKDLNAICETEGVIGYHYTRSLKERIISKGLVLCNGESRRQDFLAEFGEKFTENQRQRLLKGWKNYFNDHQNKVRDARIWFVLTLNALDSSGVKNLLHHYGGEVIYMPFKGDKEIAEILHTIGEPMIVECALDTSMLHTYSQIPYGKVWLSTYHLSVNPEAEYTDFDIHCSCPIPPAEIIAIHPVSIAD